MSEPDLNELRERYRRRVVLMREMGKINRMQRRANIAMIVAIVLGGLALLGVML